MKIETSPKKIKIEITDRDEADVIQLALEDYRNKIVDLKNAGEDVDNAPFNVIFAIEECYSQAWQTFCKMQDDSEASGL